MMVLPWIQETDLLTNSSFSVSGKTLMELFFDRILAVLRYILPIFRIIKKCPFRHILDVFIKLIQAGIHSLLPKI